MSGRVPGLVSIPIEITGTVAATPAVFSSVWDLQSTPKFYALIGVSGILAAGVLVISGVVSRVPSFTNREG